MTFPGLPKVQDRANVIAFLRTQADGPIPLPTADEIKKAEDDAKDAAERRLPHPRLSPKRLRRRSSRPQRPRGCG